MIVLSNVWSLVDVDHYASTRATTILGARSMYPCPICLIPSDQLWDLSEVMYPRRTWAGVRRLILDANGASSKKAAKEILGLQSVRNVSVSCIGWLSALI